MELHHTDIPGKPHRPPPISPKAFLSPPGGAHGPTPVNQSSSRSRRFEKSKRVEIPVVFPLLRHRLFRIITPRSPIQQRFALAISMGAGAIPQPHSAVRRFRRAHRSGEARFWCGIPLARSLPAHGNRFFVRREVKQQLIIVKRVFRLDKLHIRACGGNLLERQMRKASFSFGSSQPSSRPPPSQCG